MTDQTADRRPLPRRHRASVPNSILFNASGFILLGAVVLGLFLFAMNATSRAHSRTQLTVSSLSAPFEPPCAVPFNLLHCGNGLARTALMTE